MLATVIESRTPSWSVTPHCRWPPANARGTQRSSRTWP